MISRNVIKRLFAIAASSTPLSPQQLTEARTYISHIPTLERLRREEIAIHQEMKIACPTIETPYSLDAKDEYGYTVLMRAAGQNHPPMVQALIEAKVDLNIQDNQGQTALYWAVNFRHYEVMRELIEAKVDLNIQDNKGQTALYWAANFSTHSVVVRELVKAGADLNIQNKKGETALMEAAWRGHLVTVQALIEAKVDLNTQDKEGCTALVWAAHKGRSEVVQELIEAGTKLEFQHRDGHTALDIAIHERNLQIVSLLLSHGARVRDPQKLLNFLSVQDQQDRDVLVSLQRLYEQLNPRSPIKEMDAIEAKQSMALVLKPEIGQLYIKKLKDFHTANKGFCSLWIDEAFLPRLPRDIVRIIEGYEDRYIPVIPRSPIVFLKPATLDSPFRDLISQMREKTKKTPRLFDEVIEEINCSSFPGFPVKKRQYGSLSAPTNTPEKEYKSIASDSKKSLGMIGIGQGSSGLGVGIALVVTGLSLTGGWILLAASALILLTCLLKAAADCYKVKKAYEQQRLFLPNVSSVPQSSVSPPRLQIGFALD